MKCNIVNLIGNITRIDDATGSTYFYYDLGGRLIKQENPTKQTEITYTYDQNGNRTSLTYRIGNHQRTINYTYDARNLLTQIQSYTGTTTFAYDELGNLIEKHLPNGIKEEYNYDDMGRLTQIAYGTTGRTISYSYDSVGNVLSMTDWTGTTNYSYDNIYQLTSATYPNIGTQNFTYDPAGNRIQNQNKTYYYNNLNQLLSTSDGTNYTYDLNGNLTSKTKNNQTTTYTWDTFDKLREIELPDGKKIRFVYGADGLRRERIEEERVNYLLDGLVVLCEFGDSGEVLREFVGGVSVCLGSESFYYHYDRLGSVKFLSDASGNIIQEYNYDAFGNLLISSGSLNQPYEYVGREGYYREEFDLYLLGVRWYDSEAGRFISRDLIIENDNLYFYCINNPLNFTDPFGLAEIISTPEGVCGSLHINSISDVDISNLKLEGNCPPKMFIKFFLKSQKGKDLDITCPKCYECKNLRPVIKNEWIEFPIEYYLKTNAWDCKISGTFRIKGDITGQLGTCQKKEKQ